MLSIFMPCFPKANLLSWMARTLGRRETNICFTALLKCLHLGHEYLFWPSRISLLVKALSARSSDLVLNTSKERSKMGSYLLLL